jgi:hypothetical protein
MRIWGGLAFPFCSRHPPRPWFTKLCEAHCMRLRSPWVLVHDAAWIVLAVLILLLIAEPLWR